MTDIKKVLDRLEKTMSTTHLERQKYLYDYYRKEGVLELIKEEDEELMNGTEEDRLYHYIHTIYLYENYQKILGNEKLFADFDQLYDSLKEQRKESIEYYKLRNDIHLFLLDFRNFIYTSLKEGNLNKKTHKLLVNQIYLALEKL